MDKTDLDRLLLEAHDRNDFDALIRYYTMAADECETAQDIDAACFYLTHAFVFALEFGAAEADALNARLAAYGRAHRLDFLD
ncbi:hypothetical protein RUESEDTHA_02875 [Ruegeria sp. THAF57]|uniref:hypothetical protein n=1 Tax=Ruegeria sp. THAF57 TaxID=2744555 RepID=UPI0015DF848F|nr:hypothetical protein [Ruegeria sp. THAF57]CAD0185972.1 hypothetical protein RUESEDTHA_02875 [Ruegeria sp. THAF57]